MIFDLVLGGEEEEEGGLDENGLDEFGGSKRYGEKEAPGFYQRGDENGEEEEEEEMKRARQLEMFERSLRANSAYPVVSNQRKKLTIYVSG